jgi:hypothetical protein
MRKPAAVALGAALAGAAAIGISGYAVAGPTGLIDVASVVAIVVLIVARGLVRGEKPAGPRITWPGRTRREDRGAAEFPGYRKIFSDLSWAQVTWRHYEHPLRPMLTRLAAALDRPPHDSTVAADLAVTRDPDGPGIDLPTLDRIVTKLEAAPPA